MQETTQPRLQTGPVLSLQRMLNYISRFNPAIPRLEADGIFGEQTLEAVMIFQRDHDLPVTGVVDLATWTAIADLYQEMQFTYGPPPMLAVLPCGTYTCCQGQQSRSLYVVQAMFNALCTVADNFRTTDPGDKNDGDTWDNLCTLQKLCGLPVNGTLDRSTWAYLAQLYAAMVTRSLLQ